GDPLARARLEAHVAKERGRTAPAREVAPFDAVGVGDRAHGTTWFTTIFTSRAPGLACGVPLRVMRASTRTAAALESFASGDIAMVSSSANFMGRSRTEVRITASGMRAPPSACAKMKRVS